MPLFDSYSRMTEIFGKNIRTGVISYATARKYVLQDDLSGIIVAPGSRETIITAEELKVNNEFQ